MNPSRLLLTAAWIASLAVAYVIGSSGDSSRHSAAANPAPISEPPVALKSPVSTESGSEEQRDESKPGVRSIIARARHELGGGMGGMMNIRGMLRAMAPFVELDDSQIQEALAEVEQSVREPQQKMMFYSLLLGQWAETDGRAAMTYAQEKLGKGSMFDAGVTSSVLSTWARSDPEAAWKWFTTEQPEDASDRSRMMSVRSIFAGMAANNLDSAFARIATLDEQSRPMALNGIAGSATDDASRRSILDRTASLPPDQRAQMRQAVAGQWAMSDPDATVAWMESLPAEEQTAVRQSAGQMILMMKPALGAEVMMEGADEKDRPRLYERVVSQWAQQDARAAGEWLTKQPQGPELDGARQSFARVVVQRDPSAAMDWARSVQDADQRNASVGQIYQMWRAKDAPAADVALDGSGLPPDEVKKLREAKAPGSTGAKGGDFIYGF